MMSDKSSQNRVRKWRKSILPLLLCLSFITLLAACGADKGTFRMEGSFKGFSQGELYLYSTDGGIRKLDTIPVRNGKFSYQVPLDTTATFILVFPNYSEVPVIGGSGITAKVEGDASHLKEVEVKGSKDNELLTGFRLKSCKETPPEIVKSAATFIKEHPAAPASLYLLNKYFIQTVTPDYKQAKELAEAILKAKPDSKLQAIIKQLDGLKELRDNNTLPKFVATDIKGKPISSADLYAKVNVITTWATWNYESMNVQRQLKAQEKEHGSSQLKIVSFCLDASVRDCRKFMERDSITWTNVCDGQMWETPALAKLGLTKVPDNIITDSKGKIIAHSLPVNELIQCLSKHFAQQ